MIEKELYCQSRTGVYIDLNFFSLNYIKLNSDFIRNSHSSLKKLRFIKIGNLEVRFGIPVNHNQVQGSNPSSPDVRR